MPNTESAQKETNYTIPLVILSLIIIGATGYFAKFWYDALFSNKPISSDVATKQSATATPSPETATIIEKTQKPKVNLFVMSFCPYGNLAENTIKPVIDLLGDKVDWNLNYVVSVNGTTVSSLHGQPETDQNVRELCVGELYNSAKMWDFILYVNENCGSNGSCWKDGAISLGLDTGVIETCVADKTLELMTAEAKIASEFGAQASPTFFINGTKDNSIYSYGNPNVVKEAICSAFVETPEECAVVLESTNTNVSGSCN